jgi:DNA-binding IclR family transcriptional regulator
MINGKTSKRVAKDPRSAVRLKSTGRGREAEPRAAAPKSRVGSKYSVQSLMLGLDVLEALAYAGNDRGVTELAEHLGTTKWRIFRHLHSLTEGGYVMQDPATGKFRIGRRTYSLIEALPHRFSFVREARSEMTALRDQLGHSIVLAAAADDTGVVVVDAIDGRQAVQFNLKVGAIFDLHASAHGKAALAFGPSDWLENVIERGLRRHTEFTITDARALRREVGKIRNQGWASAYEESFRGVNTVVAPIFSARNYVGTIAIFGSIEAIPRNPSPKDIEAVKAAAQRVSQKLEWK